MSSKTQHLTTCEFMLYMLNQSVYWPTAGQECLIAIIKLFIITIINIIVTYMNTYTRTDKKEDIIFKTWQK